MSTIDLSSAIKIYKIIIAKIAFKENRINKIKEININKYAGIFAGSFRFLIFKENIGMFEIIKNEIISERQNNTTGIFNRLIIKGRISDCRISGNEANNSPEAGVGKPRKYSDCSVLILNFASLKEDATTIKTGEIKNSRLGKVRADKSDPYIVIFRTSAISKKRMIAGAIPKLIRSARESNCLPRSEYAFSSLAENPSRKSKTAAMKIRYDAIVKSPYIENKIERTPQTRFSVVIVFGICFLITYILNTNVNENMKLHMSQCNKNLLRKVY